MSFAICGRESKANDDRVKTDMRRSMKGKSSFFSGTHLFFEHLNIDVERAGHQAHVDRYEW